MESQTTSLSQLPNYQNNQPAQLLQQQPQQNNIILKTNEIINESTNQLPNRQPQMQQPQMQQQQMQQPQQQQVNSIQNDNPNYNELVNQLQEASRRGATELPSRDIPMDPTQAKNDVEVKPNYIPEPKYQEDYIKNQETPENLIHENNQEILNNDRLNYLINEIQIPLIISLLYFLFQLPVIRKYSQKFVPMLYKTDGNLNLYGHLANSILFGSVFYIIFKAIKTYI
jgi:hypothetical protein